MKTINLDVALQLIDEMVPQYLALAALEPQQATTLFNTIFQHSSNRLIEHLTDHWVSKNGEFGSFYLNLDEEHRRMLLEYWGIEVESDKYPDYDERMKALIFGADKVEVYPFQTHVLHQFLLLANNRSIEVVKKMTNGDVLFYHLTQSKVDAYGTGVNWGKYYLYLLQHGVEERKSIVEFAYSFR